MHRLPLLFCALALVTATFLFPDPATAQSFGPSMRPSRAFEPQWRSQQRQVWRPQVRVVRARGESRELAAGASRTIAFSVKRGFVSRLEVRAGQKVIRTIPLNGPVSSGRLTFKVPAGSRHLKLWAWQGQAGYQSIHGESIKYTLIP